jgi:lysosomal Pro-X carboxypeptidase
VAAFGGSYGGMLASYARMKYPHVFQAAYASSAPILYFEGSPLMDPYQVSNMTSAAFNLTEYPECAAGIKEGLEMVMNTTDYTKLTDNFNTCYPIDSKAEVQDLYDRLEFSLRGLAMFNYPNESDFNVYLPPEPIKHFCMVFDSSKGTSFYKLAHGAIMFRQRDYEKGYYGCTDNAPKITSAWDALACN